MTIRQNAARSPTDVVNAVFDWYMNSDLNSASSDPESAIIYDEVDPSRRPLACSRAGLVAHLPHRLCRGDPARAA